MCARFSLASPEKVAEYFQGRLVFDEPPRYNIAPSDAVLAAILEGGVLGLEPQRWGLHMSHRPQAVINLRSETTMIAKTFDAKPSFRRCLIPATGFFEWREENGVKQPYHFALRSGEAFAFAGLCKAVPDGPPECAILTTEPNGLVAQYHDRMPSLIAKEDAETWLGGSSEEEVISLARLPFREDRMLAFPVTRKMGNPRFQGEESVRPSEPENPTLF